MKALSVRQPWAWLIVHGYKDIENRTWVTPYRGPLLIQAGAAMAPPEDREYAAALCRRLGIALPETFDRGGIVGLVRLVDFTDESPSPWFGGPYGWMLREPHPLTFTPWLGRLGLFDVDVAALTLTPEERRLLESMGGAR